MRGVTFGLKPSNAHTWGFRLEYKIESKDSPWFTKHNYWNDFDLLISNKFENLALGVPAVHI